MADKNPWPRATQPLWSGLSILLGIGLVVQLLLAVFASYELWNGVVTAQSVADPATIAVLLAGLLFTIIWILVLLLCVVYTSRITFRMMKNLDVLEAPGERMSPTMAVAWYFIPIANLLMPLRGVRQIWKGTFDLASEPGPDDGVVTIWWVLWIISNITGTISLRMSIQSGGMNEMGPTNLELYNMSLWVGCASSVLGALACWFMIKTFAPLARAQDAIIGARATRTS